MVCNWCAGYIFRRVWKCFWNKRVHSAWESHHVRLCRYFNWRCIDRTGKSMVKKQKESFVYILFYYGSLYDPVFFTAEWNRDPDVPDLCWSWFWNWLLGYFCYHGG